MRQLRRSEQIKHTHWIEVVHLRCLDVCLIGSVNEWTLIQLNGVMLVDYGPLSLHLLHTPDYIPCLAVFSLGVFHLDSLCIMVLKPQCLTSLHLLR